jgi:DNA repair protein RadC
MDKRNFSRESEDSQGREKPRILKSQEGHRRRLREKLIRAGISGFHDYEIVELLLTLGTPRKDCKQQAKEVIKKLQRT